MDDATVSVVIGLSRVSRGDRSVLRGLTVAFPKPDRDLPYAGALHQAFTAHPDLTPARHSPGHSGHLAIA